ncbi:MAG: hypothetical protein L3J10_03165 [Sulfurimonas sp.]|nr:hypothetical protein [Sulfurimonas sp.]
MKPLLAKELPEFLKRFGNFVDTEFRHIKIISPTIIIVSLAGQDSARGFDWISVDFEFSGVSDTRLLDNSKLSHIDMSDGISILFESTQFIFGIGSENKISALKNSICQITSSTLKYQEGSF